MAFGSLIIILAIFVLSGVVIIRPFWVELDTRKVPHPGKYDSLLAERERLLSSIEDLDLEYDLKKISSQEHTRNRDILLAQAAEVLMELDKLGIPSKNKQQLGTPPVVGDDLEKMIAARRRELQQEKSNFCSSCGKAVKAGDQYCGHCGAEL